MSKPALQCDITHKFNYEVDMLIDSPQIPSIHAFQREILTSPKKDLIQIMWNRLKQTAQFANLDDDLKDSFRERNNNITG